MCTLTSGPILGKGSLGSIDVAMERDPDKAVDEPNDDVDDNEFAAAKL